MSKEFWTERWEKSETPWDIGMPHPALAGLLKRVKDSLGELSLLRGLVPGCGSGHDVVALHEAGMGTTLAIDVAPGAIERARSLYGHLGGLRFECIDFFDEHGQESSIDLILDHAMMCALPQELRPRYLSECARLLRPGGLFLSICFDRVAPEVKGPPFGIPLPKVRELLERDFEEVAAQVQDAAVRNPIIKRESLLHFARKAT